MERKALAKIIPLPLRSREAGSVDSGDQPSGAPASVVLLRSLQEMPPREFASAGTISPRGHMGYQPPESSRRLSPKWKRLDQSLLCRESLALRHSIMDDKSMQGWMDSQLTAGGQALRIVSVGRPKDTVSPSTYNTQFIRRVRAARELFTAEPKEMARALGVREDTYYRYEKRTMLPHHLIEPFCQLTGVTVDWLINGPRRAEARQPLEKTA